MKSTRHRSNEQLIAMIILCAATLAAIVFCIILIFTDRARTIHLTGGSLTYYIDEEPYELSAEPLLCDNTEYIPAADILSQCGYEIGWDSDLDALSVSDNRGKSYIYLNSNNVLYRGDSYVFEKNTFSRRDVFYIPVEMLHRFTVDKIEIDGDIRTYKIPVRDCLEDTFIDDSHRLNGTVEVYNGVYLIGGNTAMEGIGFPDGNSLAYAEVINSIADALPDVDVYDIVVPSMSEFYGPRQVYTDQVSGIRKIYSSLSGNVMPVNAVRELWAHADEKLYFNTDHHWTQRGAYYAYKAFTEVADLDAMPLNEFEQRNVDDFVGSWLRMLKGTRGEAQIAASGELLERFLPRVTYTGDIYSDMELQKRQGESWVVNLNDDTYSTFICGDEPITRYKTNAGTGRKAVLLKESYGNAFATWIVNHYDELYVIDPRYWNGVGGNNNPMKLTQLYDELGGFDDLIVLSYPVSAAEDMRNAMKLLVE